MIYHGNFVFDGRFCATPFEATMKRAPIGSLYIFGVL